jgi:hypothetical protein
MPMPLPVAVESLDAIPEAARAAYVEKDGAFVLDVELEDTSGLKSALQKEREAAKAATRAAKELEARLAAFETEKAATAAGLTSEKLKEIEQQVAERIRGEYEPKLAKAQEAEARSRSNALKAALAPHVVDADDAVALLADQFEFTDDGVPMPKGGEPGAMDTFIQSLATKKPHLFRGTAAAGGGANGAGSPGAAGREKGRAPTEWTPAEKMEYAQAHGRDALMRLFEAEGKKRAEAQVTAMQQPPRAA